MFDHARTWHLWDSVLGEQERRGRARIGTEEGEEGGREGRERKERRTGRGAQGKEDKERKTGRGGQGEEDRERRTGGPKVLPNSPACRPSLCANSQAIPHTIWQASVVSFPAAVEQLPACVAVNFLTRPIVP